MLGFLRRRGSRGSGLGAAVTGIPSLPVTPRPVAAVPPPALAPEEPSAPVAPPAPVVPPAPVAEAPLPVPGPRVELGFRDGSSTALDPSSEAAQALDELARLLAGRP